MKRFYVALLGTALVGTSASAQEKDAATRVIGSFSACRGIDAAAARLACFDAAAAALERSVKDKDVRIVDRADVRKARRSLFGLNLPGVAVLGGDDDRQDREAFTEINTTVRSAGAGPHGRAEIALADESAAVWQTTDPMPFPPKPGTAVRIRKGAMGGYFLNVGGRSYRALRLR